MKLKLTILSIITFSMIAFSEITVLEEKDVDENLKIKVLCIDGYKFVSQYCIANTGTSSNLMNMHYTKGGYAVIQKCECEKEHPKEKK